MNFIKFVHEKLSVDAISDLVASPRCGAISFFVGTTRDYFNDRKVVSLEYEAYESMAIKAMEDLCCEIRNQWTEVENVAIYHRLGSVPVKEASVIIAVSSPHRAEAIQATQWCIDHLKQSVPIWKKETYENDAPEWKENKESSYSIPKRKIFKPIIQHEPEVPNLVPPYLNLVKATNEEIDNRIEAHFGRKRNNINVHNIGEFCNGDRSSDFTCARIDSSVKKRIDSKGHLQVDRVVNTCYHRDQLNSEYMTRYIPPNGVEERLQNLESELSLITPVPRNIYKRLKSLEDRMLELEAISPEYIQFWDKTNGKSVKKKQYSIDEIDYLIKKLEGEIKAEAEN